MYVFKEGQVLMSMQLFTVWIFIMSKYFISVLLILKVVPSYTFPLYFLENS